MDRFDSTESIAEDIVRFGIENETAIRKRCVEEVARFFDVTDVGTMIPKYREGVKEHGGMTGGKLETFDLGAELRGEMIDVFWYCSMRMYREFQQFDADHKE